MNSKQFETAKMCLKVVTPINIADGVTLRAKDYLYDARQRRVYFLNLHAWHWFVYKHKLLDKYEKYISNFKNPLAFVYLLFIPLSCSFILLFISVV